MEPIAAPAHIAPQTVEPIKSQGTEQRVDTKKMVEWHGRILAYREENRVQEKKIVDYQKQIDKLASKLGDTKHINDEKANKLLEAKLIFIEEQKKARERISGNKSNKEELKTKLEAARVQKSKEVEEDLVEVSKALDAEHAKLAENEKILKGLEEEAGKSQDVKTLREVREKIKSQQHAVQACHKEISEIKRRKELLILESYAFGKILKTRLFDPPLKGKSIKPRYIEFIKNDQEVCHVRCWIEHPKKDMIYIPVAKLLKKDKVVEQSDSTTSSISSNYLYTGTPIIKFKAVPGVSVQNCSNLEFTVTYKELSDKHAASNFHYCWELYSTAPRPED